MSNSMNGHCFRLNYELFLTPSGILFVMYLLLGLSILFWPSVHSRQQHAKGAFGRRLLRQNFESVPDCCRVAITTDTEIFSKRGTWKMVPQTFCGVLQTPTWSTTKMNNGKPLPFSWHFPLWSVTKPTSKLFLILKSIKKVHFLRFNLGTFQIQIALLDSSKIKSRQFISLLKTTSRLQHKNFKLFKTEINQTFTCRQFCRCWKCMTSSVPER